MHISVLLNEVIRYLDPKPGENFIDCTIGEAGHSLAILEQTKPDGKVLGIDTDLDSLNRIKPQDRLILVHGNFKDLKKIVQEKNFQPVNGILFDLGLSSWQIEESGKGFSFKRDEPFLAKTETILNQWSEQELFRIFKEYGEERYSRRIAKRIINERRIKPIKTTFQLSEVIKKAAPYSKTKPACRRGRRGRVDRMAARIFQALRIVVNDELENLKQGLEQALEILKPGDRLVVISFHSLEDRIVKNFFRNNNLEILTKKPVRPTEIEIKNNPRSRSAKLRAIIKR